MSTDFEPGEVSRRLLAATIDGLSRTRQLVRSDDLLRHGAILSVATVLGGGLNYGYQILVGRALGPAEYGAFGAVFALVYLLNVVGQGVRFAASRFAAERLGRERQLAAFHGGLLRRAGLFGLLAFAALVGLSSAIAEFLAVEQSAVVVVAANGLFALALAANQGTLQGLQAFGALATVRVGVAGLKLLVGAALLALGFGILGALGAVAVASALALAATTNYFRTRLTGDGDSAFDYRRTYRYAPSAILAGFCLAVPGTVDIIVVKHFFESAVAGRYAAAAVFGKILLFLPMGITTALFPKVTDGATDRRRLDALLYRALGYAALLAGGGAVAFWLIPEFLVTLFYGSAYREAAPLLGWYGLAAVAYSLAIVVLHFQLALDRTRFVYAMTAGSIVEIALMWRFHSSTVQVIQVILLTNVALFAFGLVVVTIESRHAHRR